MTLRGKATLPPSSNHVLSSPAVTASHRIPPHIKQLRQPPGVLSCIGPFSSVTELVHHVVNALDAFWCLSWSHERKAPRNVGIQKHAAVSCQQYKATPKCCSSNRDDLNVHQTCAYASDHNQQPQGHTHSAP